MPPLPATDQQARAVRYEALVGSHLDALHRTAFRLTGGRKEDAEDLVQETFLRAGSSLDQLVDATGARAWLFSILRHAFIDTLRRADARPKLVSFADAGAQELDASPEVPALVPADFADRQTMERCFDEEVLAAMAALPEEFRLPLLFHAVGGLSYQEIARALDCPIGTVMSRLHRARAALRNSLIGYARRTRIVTTREPRQPEEDHHASA